MRDLREVEPIVRETFAEADVVMRPLLGRPLSDIIFVDPSRAAEAEEQLKQTAVTQPAILATDVALHRLLGAYGIAPDLVMGHSLGEYGAMVVAGVLPFARGYRVDTALFRHRRATSRDVRPITAGCVGCCRSHLAAIARRSRLRAPPPRGHHAPQGRSR